jgi:hypothetical protein
MPKPCRFPFEGFAESIEPNLDALATDSAPCNKAPDQNRFGKTKQKERDFMKHIESRNWQDIGKTAFFRFDFKCLKSPYDRLWKPVCTV